MKEFRCVEGLVVGGPGGRIVAVGRRVAAEAWVKEVGLDILQWVDFDDEQSARNQAYGFIEGAAARFQPVDRDRETLDVWWMGVKRSDLDRNDAVVKKVLGPHFA